MGRRKARQGGPHLDKRRGRVPQVHLRRPQGAERPHGGLLHAARHRQGRHGDAHTQAPLRVLALNAGTAQDRGRGHTRHAHAHEARHRLPQHEGRHKGHSVRGRGVCARAGGCRHAREPVGQGARERWPKGARGLPRLAQGVARGTGVRAPGAPKRQLGHHADVLHQRHERRAEDGGPRLPLRPWPLDHGRVLA